MAEPSGRLDERADGLVVGDGRIAVVDVELGRALEAHRAGGDDQVADLDVLAQHAARADADERRVLGDRQDLGEHDLDVVRADAGRDARDAPALVRAGGRGELAVAVLVLDRCRRARPLSPSGPGRRAAGCTRRCRPGRRRCGTGGRCPARQRDGPRRPMDLLSARPRIGRAETIGSRCAQRQPRSVRA